MSRLIAVATAVFALALAGVAQAAPSHWSQERVPLAEGQVVQVTSSYTKLKVVIEQGKSKVRATCTVAYSIGLRNGPQYGEGEVSSFSISGCSVTSGAACETPLTLKTSAGYQTKLQWTDEPPSGYVDEWGAAVITVPCYGAFTTSDLVLGAADNDYAKEQDDIDHDLKFHTPGATLTDSAGATLSLTGTTKFEAASGGFVGPEAGAA